MKCMTLTLSNIPSEVERELQRRAQAEGRSVDELAARLLIDAVGARPFAASDFNDIIGTWISDPQVEEALRDQDRIDPDLWR